MIRFAFFMLKDLSHGEEDVTAFIDMNYYFFHLSVRPAFRKFLAWAHFGYGTRSTTAVPQEKTGGKF